MAHFALQKLHIRPKVLVGEGSINEPIDEKERAFIYGSIQLRAETENKNTPKNKARKGGRRIK